MSAKDLGQEFCAKMMTDEDYSALVPTTYS
jgi:hypothetical protein